MKLIFALIALIALAALAGCQSFNKALSYAQSNPIIVNVATKQAVARFVNGGDTPEAKTARALEVERVVRSVEHFLEGNPTASSKTILLVLKANVDFDALSVADRLLVDDILTVVEANLSKNEQAGLLDDRAVIRIRVLLRTLMQTAALFK